ncbi:ABC transporter permease [Sulfolobus sp. S-194]|uniref:ABC transporter permease n=1 Tax=Sulfolobus sp. S-194 TaxID=2512240 RepID=UPI001436FFFA|nr:ABC transporter permease [Sulfolobus sp. S-194]QIW23817.1 ABC transporter permease [Sulfolobus sp. S-194]
MENKKRTYLFKIISNKEFASIFTLLVLWILFYILNPSFLSLNNLSVLFTVIPIYGITVLGVTILMIAGEFDLSVAATFALVPLVIQALTADGLTAPVAIIIGLLFAAFIGFLNGIITLKSGIPSFIVTLGTLFVWLGIALQISGGQPHPFILPSITTRILSGNIAFNGLINSQLIWLIIFGVLFYLMLERHKWGNWIYATGGNKDAARAMGIKVDYVKLGLFILCAVLAGFSGIMESSLYGQVIANQGGNLELDAIAAAVIGGTSLFGGEGSILGGIIGTIIIWSIENGLILAGVSSYVYETLIGALIIVVVIVHRYTKKIAKNIRLGELNE